MSEWALVISVIGLFITIGLQVVKFNTIITKLSVLIEQITKRLDKHEEQIEEIEKEVFRK